MLLFYFCDQKNGIDHQKSRSLFLVFRDVHWTCLGKVESDFLNLARISPYGKREETRPRRHAHFTDRFKAEAVRLTKTSGRLDLEHGGTFIGTGRLL